MTKLWKLLSWRNLGIIRYNSIWQNISALFFIALVEQLYSLQFLGQVGLFILFSTIMTGYGYLINDFADIELDAKQGKSNVFAKMNKRKAAFIVLLSLLVGSLFASPFLNRPQFVLVWLVWIGAATAYSLPPLRLKVHGLSGLIVTIVAQQTLPTMLLFAAFGAFNSWGMVAFVLYATARGTSSDVSHQMRDWAEDAKSGAETFAVRYGFALTQKVYALSLELERLTLGLLLVLLALTLPPVSVPLINWEMPLILPVLLLYLPLFALTAGRSWRALKRGNLSEQDPYNETRQAQVKDALYVIHHPLPSVIFPFYLACWLSLFYWPNIIFLLVLAALYGLYSPQRWKNTWPLRPLLAKLSAH